MTIMRMDEVSAKVLVVESDPLMLTAMASVLDMQGHRVVIARSEQLAVSSSANGDFDVLVLSIDELQSGCEFAAKLRAEPVSRDVPIIFLVPELSSSWMPKLAVHGGISCMLKPVDPYELIEMVEKALWMPHLARSRTVAPSTHLAKQKDWITLSE